jgi:predicted transcriptional regulator
MAKFTDEQLQALLDQGRSQVEIAKLLNVSKAAISLRVKRLKDKQNQDLCAVLDESKASELSTSLKDQLTEKEIKFIEFYLSGGETIESAMIKAGYEGYHPGSLRRLSRQIVTKYENQAPDHRKIFQAVGLGVARVAKKISDAMDTAKSETVQFNYTQLAAKALGITQDVEQSSQGLTIIVQAHEGSPTQINVAAQEPGRGQLAGYTHPTGPPGKPIQIIR